MVRNKHQEDSTNGKEGDNGLEEMVSSFGLQEGLNKNKTELRSTAVMYKIDSLVYGMERTLV